MSLLPEDERDDYFIERPPASSYRRRIGKLLGRKLKPSEVIHHHSATELVVCQDKNYHWLLHARSKTLEYGGNPDTQRVCTYCHCPRLFADFPYGIKADTTFPWCPCAFCLAKSA